LARQFTQQKCNQAARPPEDDFQDHGAHDAAIDRSTGARAVAVHIKVNSGEISHSRRDILTIQLTDPQESASSMPLLPGEASGIVQPRQVLEPFFRLFAAL
jgi:hypothetical protein